jgi:anti-sigma factor ChrR (cupin superfamily)
MEQIRSSERVVLNIRKAQFKPYIDEEGHTLPGQTYLQLDDTFPQGAGFTIYKMEPGSQTQPHEHTCHEQFLLLEGDLTDNDGYSYSPGDFVMLKQGTQHFSTTKNGALLAVFFRTMERNL